MTGNTDDIRSTITGDSGLIPCTNLVPNNDGSIYCYFAAPVTTNVTISGTPNCIRAFVDGAPGKQQAVNLV